MMKQQEIDDKLKPKKVKNDKESEASKAKKKRKRDKKNANKTSNAGEKAEGGSVADILFFPEKHDKSKAATPIVGMDCEMVEVDHTSDGLARVSIVNYNGHVLMDTYVRPKGEITNYRSWVSGVYPQSMKGKVLFCFIIV
jgi:RNA exonuclease 4